MFKVMVTRWQDSRPYLGAGTYFHKPCDIAASHSVDWVAVTLRRPLILDMRQVRMLVAKYDTESSDEITAHAGARTLRHELLQTGHDGIVTTEATGGDCHLIVVDLAPGTADDPGDRAMWRKIHRSTNDVDWPWPPQIHTAMARSK